MKGETDPKKCDHAELWPSRITTSAAVHALTAALRADDEYRETWVANLTMAAIDEGVSREQAEASAHRFLGWLCVKP